MASVRPRRRLHAEAGARTWRSIAVALAVLVVVIMGPIGVVATDTDVVSPATDGPMSTPPTTSSPPATPSTTTGDSSASIGGDAGSFSGNAGENEDGLIDTDPPKTGSTHRDETKAPTPDTTATSDHKSNVTADSEDRSLPDSNGRVVLPPTPATTIPSTTAVVAKNVTTAPTTTPPTTSAQNEQSVGSTTPAPTIVASPYRSTFLRCTDNECQNEFLGQSANGVCVSQLNSGSCPSGFNKGVSTSSYKVQVLPTSPNSVADVTFSLLAADIAGALYNVGHQNAANWWVAFRLPSGWRFVTWSSTTVDVELVMANGSTLHQQLQVYPCNQITDEKNCRGDSTDTDSVGFVAVKDMLGDWSSLVTSSDSAPLTFRLEKSVVSGPTTNGGGQVGVFIVYESGATTAERRRLGFRELLSSAASSSGQGSSSLGVTGNLTVVALANMEAPTITTGQLYSSLLWVEVQKRKATLSFSTSTIIGSNSNNPKVCVNLRPTSCNDLGLNTNANASFDAGYLAWYVKDGNPFLQMYAVPGNAPLSVEPVNETYFCVKDLMPTGIDFNKTWEVQQEFKFQLYVSGVSWSTPPRKNVTDATTTASVPVLAEVVLIDRGIVQGSDCAQIIVHDQPASNHGLSVYSVMSVTIYSVAFVGAVLITRMNGITFSGPTFYNDMTSVCVVVIFLLSIVGNAVWITVSSNGQTTNASHIYYLIRILTSCFAWSMMTSVCFHWSTVLNHDVRRIRRVYLMLFFVTINVAFFACSLFVLISMSDFFKCAYDDYLKNPKYDKRMCDTDYCPDLQPFQWKYAANQLCRAVPYAGWYFASAFTTELLMFLASVALLVLGTYVLRRGSRLIEHSGTILDERIVTVMRNSLKTYLIVILAITLSLGASMAINVALYSGNWSINAIVWYAFTVWLPTVVPPAGFLVLQWNPRLHGISWSGGGNNNPTSAKNRRETKDDELKRLGRGDSTFGLLSDGWAGITDFPDTDYLPIGAETNQGTSRQLLTLSAQLITPPSISHACYMELYVGESADVNEVKDEFELDAPGRPRGSISAMIQSGLLRESMIVSQTVNGNRLSRGNGTLLKTSIPATGISWRRVGFTETVLPSVIRTTNDTESQVATFMSVIQIPVLPPSSMLRFVVYELPESPSSSPSSGAAKDESRPRAVTDVIRPPSLQVDDPALGGRVSGLGLAHPSKSRVFCEFTCQSLALSDSDQIQLVAQEGSYRARHRAVSEECLDESVYEETSSPVLRVRTATVSTRTLKESSSFYTTKCFQFAEGDEMVVEDMTESVFTNEIPRQFLELLHKERSQDLSRAEHELRAFEAKCQRGLATGLYDNLIDQIQGENVQAVAQSWLEERVQQRTGYLQMLKQCQQLCIDRAEEGINFKASTEKKSHQLRFLPINLHVQDMWVGPTHDLSSQLSRRTSDRVKLYSGVTVGAFAAHCFKFRHGAGVLSMRGRLVKRVPTRSASDRVLLARIDSGLSEKTTPLPSPALVEHDLDWTEAAVRSEDELRWQIVTRMDMCLSQALSALVASFCRNLEAALQHPTEKEFLHIIENVGFLWQVESLLSTQGKELGMLEDFYAAVDAMNGVTFVLDTAPPSHLPPTLNLHIKDIDVPSVVSVRLTGDTRSGQYTVVVGVRCRSSVLSTIPPGIRSGSRISVAAVLFTQGINEMQTLANGSSGKKTTLQQTINRDSFLSLKEYADKYRAFASRVPGVVRTDVRLVSTLLAELEERIMSAGKQMVKTKHPKIIQQSSRVCRLLSAGRVTSCKSAKDRTSMAVTLEQGQLLCDHHGLPSEFVTRTVSTMRSNGVRLENAFKNTGKRQYAFNALQRSLLPDEYKCPEGTYGRGNVS